MPKLWAVCLAACVLSSCSKDEPAAPVAAVDEPASKTAINEADRASFSELSQPISTYIAELKAAQSEDSKNTLIEFKKIVNKDQGAQAFKAHYKVSFFDQYSLLGFAVRSSTQFCDKVVTNTQLSLSSDDKELTIESNFEETQLLDHSQATYVSSYYYQVSTDKVDVNQRVEGSLKRQFNGLAHHQALPYKIDALHDKQALFLYQALTYKLEQLQTLQKNPALTAEFSYMSAPEDADSKEVLSVVEAKYMGLQLDEKTVLDTYLLSSKHFLRDEQGEWSNDGYSIEWLSSGGVVLYESFVMPTGLSMQYELNAVSLLEKPVCQ
ncbi:MAG: hypothetical protein KAG18_04275 [Sinobacterium sp.]|nr:hypothetical protein [Sinobacterium sp.]